VVVTLKRFVRECKKPSKSSKVGTKRARKGIISYSVSYMGLILTYEIKSIKKTSYSYSSRKSFTFRAEINV